MNEKRFFTKVNNKGRLVIIDKECHTELFDMTLACEVLNRLDLKLKHYNEVNGEQQATISQLKEENEQLRKQCFELEKDYLIETSDISDKIYLGDEIKELKQRYGVNDE